MSDSLREKKSILFMVQLPPPVHGASVINRELVASSAIAEKFAVDVLPLQFATDVKDIGAVSFKKLKTSAILAGRLLRRLIANKPDILYFTLSPVGGSFYRDVVFVAIMKLVRSRIIFHLHGKGIAKASQSPLNKMLYRFVFNNVEVICLAKSLAADIAAVYKGSPHIVNNGIKAVYDAACRKGDEGVPTILYLSNFARDKGVVVFLEALCSLRQRGYSFKAIIVGSPFDVSLEELLALAEDKGISSVVEISGPVYGADKDLLFQSADIFCFPTFYRNEAFPLVVLEAMQAALPVVATYEGAIPDIVDDGVTGLLSEQQNVPDLSEKLQVLITDSDLRKKMGAAGRDKFISKYTWNIFEQKMLEVFESSIPKG